MNVHSLQPRTPRGWLLAAGTLALVGLLTLGLMGGGKAAPVVTPTPTQSPGCVTVGINVGNELDVIQRQLDHGDYGTAFSVGQTALTTPGLCPADRQALAQLTINAGLKQILSVRIDNPGDAVVQQEQVQHYRDLQALAKNYQVPLPETALSISHLAYASQSFLLAIRSWEDALADGETTPTDMASLRQYVSATRNLGEWYRTAGTTPEVRQEGPRWLRTSAMVDDQYRTGDGVAAGTLRSLYGADQRRWPEPMPSPLLK